MAGRIFSVLRRAVVGVSSRKSYQHFRAFSSPPSTPAAEKPSTPELFYTLYSKKGVEVDRAGTISMRQLFQKQPEDCFENHDKGLSYFSDFSVDIFRKIVAIQYKQSLDNCYFKLNASDILIRLEDKFVLDIAIPVKQITEDKSIYKDRVVGPLTVLLHNEIRILKSTFGGIDNAEVLDLMHKAQQGTWWNSLDEILSHTLFWSLDRKMVSITLIKIWMTTSSTQYPHGMPGIPVRKRSVSQSDIRQAYSDNIFYHSRYRVTEKDGEFQVKELQVMWDWRLFFRGNKKSFHANFFLGSSGFTCVSYFCENLYTVRNIVVHWGSDSYDAIAANHGVKSVKEAFILHDANFRFSLSIFYALRKLQIVLWDIT